MYKLTVIMPVYNDVKYVSQAISSILDQSLEDIEIICVDDGSTDGSEAILDEFGEKYDFIKIIHQENQGAAACRNRAILEATGQYITFLDSDDFYYDEDALEQMYDVAIKNDANMVSANIKTVVNEKLYRNGNLEEFDEFGVMKPEDYGIPYTFGKNFYKKEFLHDNNFLFPDYVRGEDPVFLAEVLTTVDKIYCVPRILMGIRAAKYSGLFKIDTYDKKRGYIQHFHDTFEILEKNNFLKMRGKYKEKLFEFIEFSRNFADEELYQIVQEVFSDDEEILKECDDYFTFTNPKMSIVIPYYGKEYFLDKVKDNLLKQNLRDFEFIFLEKKDADYSLGQLIDFSKREPRLKIVFHENTFFEDLKDIISKNVSGDYVLFFNPEDKIKERAISDFYKRIENNGPDLVLFKVARLFDNDQIKYKNIAYDLQYQFEVEDFNEFNFDIYDIRNHVLSGSFEIFTKVYKKELFDKIDDRYFLNNNHFNHIIMHLQAMKNAENISFINAYLYYHFFNYQSLDYDYSYDNQEIFEATEMIEKYLRDMGDFEELNKEFTEFKISNFQKYMDSQDYYNRTREEFSKIELNGMAIDEKLLDQFNFILENESYDDYKEFNNELLLSILESNRDELKIELEQVELNKENLGVKMGKYEDLNESLLNSSSWKLTKPLRRIKGLLK